MKTFRVPSRRPQRRGFTLIELLVVITIIGILASLILPGVQNVRATARRTECLNNMRNVGMAMMSYASSNNGEFPQLVDGDNQLVVSNTSGTIVNTAASWPVTLMPLLDQSGLYDRLKSSSRGESFDALAGVSIKVFNCPADLDRDANGAMSYVANGGYMTRERWNGASGVDASSSGHSVTAYDWGVDGLAGLPATNTDQQVTLGTGVIWSSGGGGLKSSVDRVRDGQSQTILLSENLDVRGYIANGSGGAGTGGWSSRAVGDLCFAMPIQQGTDLTEPASNSTTNGIGVAGTAASPAKSGALALTSTFTLTTGTDATNDFSRGRINARLNVAPAGNSPRPSSLHPQAVNVIFADGSGRNLSESIDDNVYARLITSNGNQMGQQILSGF